ncbi:nuclear transport factor 2 family protein [Actinacidiphila rubida]|uniref:Ketosteroid isomerase-related protein n=1 Tax=Actinacidiphila rubida TaxID=310780 RepID=A0A1H8UAZ4_9ACTN|nr:nuclear transport factor 2 family protein [Actinacidiphila rubida]SEO63350.1 Ketosteroid isomerase-related protein [Actinacidiphila rubida]SEP00410.1 Ketosteroid isomerase-related protein [Actinacidiphila rubida]
MSADTNVATIKSIYGAFGRGDVQSILNALSDDVDWAAEAASTAAPWYGVRSGKSEVGLFFEQFGSAMEVEEFTPVAFAANEADVMAVVRLKAHHRASGRSVAMDLHHWFTFRDGLITHYRGTEDTAQVEPLFCA